MRDLRTASEGMVDFLPRWVFENYLLNEQAIAHVLNSIREEETGAVEANAVRVCRRTRGT